MTDSNPESSPDTIREAIRGVLRRLAGGTSFPDDEDVFARGIVKSINLLELITFVEDTYGFEIEQRDVFAGMLRSVDRIVELVRDRGRAR